MEATPVALSSRRCREEYQKWVATHPLYNTWRAMIRRCEEPRFRGYEYYGGRGITVCAEWHDYKTFERWILENLGPRPEGMTLDRIRNHSPYRPGNMRWATHAEQNRNRRPVLQDYREWQAAWRDYL